MALRLRALAALVGVGAQLPQLPPTPAFMLALHVVEERNDANCE